MGDERFLQLIVRPPVGLWNWQNSELNFQCCLSPLRQIEVRWGKGEFAILRAFALRGDGREQNMNGGREENTSEDENKPWKATGAI